jgi:hypothetical protein
LGSSEETDNFTFNVWRVHRHCRIKCDRVQQGAAVELRWAAKPIDLRTVYPHGESAYVSAAAVAPVEGVRRLVQSGGQRQSSIAKMASTRERDAFPKMLSRCTRLMFSPTEAPTSQRVKNFHVGQRQNFRCDEPHVCIALADIEVPMRNPGGTLDANGFRHDRMLRILVGVRDNHSIPPICVEQADPGHRPYRVRCGFHRYHASLTLGLFSCACGNR